MRIVIAVIVTVVAAALIWFSILVGKVYAAIKKSVTHPEIPKENSDTGPKKKVLHGRIFKWLYSPGSKCSSCGGKDDEMEKIRKEIRENRDKMRNRRNDGS